MQIIIPRKEPSSELEHGFRRGFYFAVAANVTTFFCYQMAPNTWILYCRVSFRRSSVNWADSGIFKNTPIVIWKVNCFLLNFFIVEFDDFQIGGDAEKTSPHLPSHLIPSHPLPAVLSYLQLFTTKIFQYKHLCECLVNPTGSWIQVKNNQLNCVPGWSAPQLCTDEIHWYLCGHRDLGGGRAGKREQGFSIIRAGLVAHWAGTGVNSAVVSLGPLVDESRTLPSAGNQLCPDE